MRLAGILKITVTIVLAITVLIACRSGSSTSQRSAADADSSSVATATVPQNLDRSCDLAQYPSVQWTQCELANFAKTAEAPAEQLNPAFVQRLTEQSLLNTQDWLTRGVSDPSWLSPQAGNTAVLPLCTSGGVQCAADPFRYPAAAGANGAPFYTDEAEVMPVVFYDRDCARLSGQVWMPRGVSDITKLPNIVITNGSVQAPQAAYWFVVQPLVRAGYMVLTFDPRGQGRSDQQSPNLQQGSNANLAVFWEGQVDAIDFFRSSPAKPYPHNVACKGTYPTTMTDFNPFWNNQDPKRLGIAGHSAGAIGVSVVQGYGAQGAEPWPGQIDTENPVKVAVAWDSFVTPEGEGLAPLTNIGAPDPLNAVLSSALTGGELPAFGPRVPSLSFSADYGFAPLAYTSPPNPDSHNLAMLLWQEAGIPFYSLTFQGTTHFDYSLIPTFPSTSWCPDPESGACEEGWGAPAIVYYSVAWFDRWLKLAGEAGYDDADQRLVDDAGSQGAIKMSFRYISARDYSDRFGNSQRCDDIRAGCL
ncbi:hypothetical protein [Zhongshania sp. BJYM1]|uniref:hypothetical protein n=1 Tax=Zhongshania aquatica TaxID=2965069 RepID=UPI0022B3FCFF|nr:hypothetical protein [Marortus sp. BJYM1]